MIGASLVVALLGLQSTPLDRRAVLRSAATVALAAPLPALAISKEAAEKKAIMRETAKEAREAIKEYKFAPRPEIQGSAETGYTFVGDYTAGTNGEMASYFTKKGEKLRAEYRTEKEIANGKLTKSEAQKFEIEKQSKEVTGKKPAKVQKIEEVELDDDTKEYMEMLKFKGRKY
jgi:hypothetical protein